jgi:hypothetical protein
LNNILWTRKITLPHRKHLHRAGLELGDLGLRVEGVDGQQVGGDFGKVPGDEDRTSLRVSFLSK